MFPLAGAIDFEEGVGRGAVVGVEEELEGAQLRKFTAAANGAARRRSFSRRA